MQGNDVSSQRYRASKAIPCCVDRRSSGHRQGPPSGEIGRNIASGTELGRRRSFAACFGEHLGVVLAELGRAARDGPRASRRRIGRAPDRSRCGSDPSWRTGTRKPRALKWGSSNASSGAFTTPTARPARWQPMKKSWADVFAAISFSASRPAPKMAVISSSLPSLERSNGPCQRAPISRNTASRQFAFEAQLLEPGVQGGELARLARRHAGVGVAAVGAALLRFARRRHRGVAAGLPLHRAAGHQPRVGRGFRGDVAGRRHAHVNELAFAGDATMQQRRHGQTAPRNGRRCDSPARRRVSAAASGRRSRSSTAGLKPPSR